MFSGHFGVTILPEFLRFGAAESRPVGATVQTSQTKERRRGARVLMRLPIEVRGIAEDGSDLLEITHTDAVSAHGAMVRTSRLPQMGSEVAVTNRFSQQTARFRIAWLGPEPSEGFWEVGIEGLRPLEEFWGLRFPVRAAP